MVQGSCLCATVRYAVEAPFESMLHCHCSMCRKHHGAAFATSVSAPFAAFRWLTGGSAIEQYASSEEGKRSFCRYCGSVTPSLLPDFDLAICPAGNLAEDTGIRPQAHIFVGSKAPWCTIADSLPQHEANPPEFGGGEGVPRPAVHPRPGVTAVAGCRLGCDCFTKPA
ncbi:MAG TPA: GFA family protein [Gammaproteobacteria bacterium]